MDWQSLFNIIAGAFGSLCLWLLRSVFKDMDMLRQNISEQQQSISDVRAEADNKFVRRDDWMAVLTRLEGKIDRLVERLDRKADRE